MRESLEYKYDQQEATEERERLTKNDPKGDKEGRPIKPFIPIEDVPESVDAEGELIDQIDNNGEKDKINEPFSQKEEILRAEIIDELNKQPISGYAESAGTAHIGPEFNEIPKDIIEENGKEELIPEKIKKLVEKPAFLSITKELRDKILSYFNYRKVDRNTGAEHDNRKTISDSERERASRKEAREVLHNL